jgi:protein involved in polysaccharide export with SLBB domain
MRAFVLLTLISLTCLTCLTAQTLQTSPEYTLDTGDVLSVVVVNHPEFSGEYAVPPDGRVLFHGAGELVVRGLTLKQVEAQLREALRQRLREPAVSVSLKQARPMLVFVEGQVGKPGAYPIQPGWRVFEAIAAAEGLKILPERAVALLLRENETIPLDLVALYHKGDPTANILLQDRLTCPASMTWSWAVGWCKRLLPPRATILKMQACAARLSTAKARLSPSISMLPSWKVALTRTSPCRMATC